MSANRLLTSPRRRAIRQRLAVVLVLLFGSSVAIAKRNDDVIIMKNGDRMTGEIKRLEDGKLIFSASYMAADVSVEWAQVERLQSKDEFNVYLTSGGAHTGLIEKKDETSDGTGRNFSINGSNSHVDVDRDEVIVIRPVEDSVWKQLTGAVDYGYNFTGGQNATTQSSLSASMAYRVQRWSMELNGSSIFNSQSEGVSTGRNTFTSLYTRKVSDRWFFGTLAQLLNSQQQDLVLRATAGGGLGRVLFRSERTSLALLSGLLFSRERYSGAEDEHINANNTEALFHLRYTTFRFKKFDWSVQLYAYPSISNAGRVRMGLESAVYIELYRNLKWKFNVYENYDTRPPIHAPKNDFGTGTSLGWTF